MPARQRQPRRRSPVRRQNTQRSPAPRANGRPHVVFLGRSPLSERVVRAIRKVGVQCRKVGEPTHAEASINERSKALVIIPPIPNFSVLGFARRRRREAARREVPIFVVMEGPLPDDTVRKLYGAGVEALFEWPSDAQSIKRTMLRLMATDELAWGRTKSPSDVALEEVAREHLKADAVPFGAELGVEARNRCVMLKGSIDSLWKLDLARQVVSDIPGVDDVVAGGVEITAQVHRDRDVARAIRQVLRHADSVEGSTLAVSVRSGEATLAGSVRDKREAQRALGLVRQVRGVRRIHDYLVVSARAKEKDQALARRVRGSLRTRFSRLPLQLAVFGGVAVLSGQVPSAGLRDRVKQFVDEQHGVERVVDKTHVRRRRRS